MNILIVGAGATGTVFGAALQRAGASITYYVREPHRARITRGLKVNYQGYFSLREERLDGLGVATSPAEVAASTFDQVWITTPSDALRGGWLPDFLPACGKATLVVLQPDPEDLQYIREHGGQDMAIVQGIIQFSAWQSPLPHEPQDLTGITVLMPPGPSAVFDADGAGSAEIAGALSRGGMRASVRHNLSAHSARLSAVMIPLVAGLELSGWQFARAARHESMALAVNAAREAVAAECARAGEPVPLAFRLLLNLPLTTILLRLMPWLPGFNAEAFFAYHFSKVDRQTRQMLATYIRHAGESGLPRGALQQLLSALPPPTH